MLKIAICDDTKEERELVEQYAKRYFDARKQPAEFEIFHSMQDVLDTGRACDLYRVCASGFLLKPVRWVDFEETMDRVCRQRLFLPQASLSVIVNRVPVELSLERISHFENRLHKAYATLTDGSVVPLSQKLSSILESVAEQEIFLRCHQSYIVNLAHVRTLEDTFFRMEDGTSVPISRAFYKEAKNAYYHYRLR